ncbi:MAG TPA: TolC family protein [Saprospiraceae bacterium]|nr:TolC family protein [Saprospiraceae bacterium]
MKRLNYIILFHFILFISFAAQAQETLALEDAIQEGLENNYAIRIARNQEQIADNSNNPGNAGMLPRVSATGTFNYTVNNTRLEFFSGESQVRPNAGNTSFRSGLAMNWTAFDGFRMFAAKDRLELVATRSRTFTQSAMQDLVTQIQTAYFGLIRLRQQIDITEQAIQLNTEIKDLAEAKLKIGTGTSLDVLQTSTRLNADSSTLVNLQDQLAQAKIGLNRLLNRDPATSFLVPSEVPSAILPTLTELTQLALRQNFQIKLLNVDEQIALAQIKEVRSGLYPSVNLTAGYDFNWSRAEAGFLVSNRSFGPSIGISTNYDLFPGRNLKKDIANAELIQKNIQLDKQNLEADIEADLAILYQQYQALGNLLQVESRSLTTAEKNTALAEELYRSGRATSFEVREAILEETRVRDRLSDVQFRQKLAEIQLKSIAGIPLY